MCEVLVFVCGCVHVRVLSVSSLSPPYAVVLLFRDRDSCVAVAWCAHLQSFSVACVILAFFVRGLTCAWVCLRACDCAPAPSSATGHFPTCVPECNIALSCRLPDSVLRLHSDVRLPS